MNIHRKGWLLVLSALLIAIAFVLRRLELSPWSAGCMLAATAAAGLPIAGKAVRALLLRTVGIELLVTAAVVGAVLIGEYWEAAAVTYLFLLGSWLEARTLAKARSSLKMLLSLAPQQASVIRDGEVREIPASEVRLGDTVLVRSGGKIPVDGLVRMGDAYIGEAVITGESLPAHKRPGDKVFSGTVVDHGYVEITAEKVGEDTAFARILALVEEAQDAKAKVQRFMEGFAAWYTPAILLLAVFVYGLLRDAELALTFLVISCPGALVISTPVSIVAGIGNGAKQGLLIKGGEALERFARIDTFAFDKTGTLTAGKPAVVSVKAYGMAESELVELAALAEQFSEHHLGRAVVTEAANRGFVRISESKSSKRLDTAVNGSAQGRREAFILASSGPTEFQVHKGKGITASVAGRQIGVGNRLLMREQGITIAETVEHDLIAEEERGRTVMLVADGQSVLGLLAVADPLRPEAVCAVRTLRQAGKRVVILTGDNARTAALIARQLQVDDCRAELLPEQKVEALRALQREGRRVAMVGDGINDAPAIAAADVGIAMGAAGTAAAAEAADVVLVSDRLQQLPFAAALARETVRNMRQNIGFAVAVVALLLVGVLLKSVVLAAGMLVHEASVLLVILNALRLAGYRRKRDHCDLAPRTEPVQQCC